MESELLVARCSVRLMGVKLALLRGGIGVGVEGSEEGKRPEPFVSRGLDGSYLADCSTFLAIGIMFETSWLSSFPVQHRHH